MKLNIIFLLIAFLISACNVADQTAQKKEAESTNASIPNSILYDQSFYFLLENTLTVESTAQHNITIRRIGENYPENQIALIKIEGTADINDISSIQVAGVPVTFINATTFEVPFTNNSPVAQITVTIAQDSIYEPNEILKLKLIENGLDYFLSGNNTHSIQINNDDGYPQVNFTTTASTSNEGTTASINISVSNFAKEDIVIPIYIDQTQSTAVENSDFTFPITSLVFNSSTALVQTLSIPIILDAINENQEKVLFKIGPPQRAEIGANAQHELSITNIGAPASYSFTAPSLSFAENSSGVITLQLTGTIANEIRVPIAIAMVPPTNLIFNTDYNMSKTEFVFPAGSTTGATDSITLTGINDALYEGDEQIIVSVADTTYGIAGATASTTITVQEGAGGETPPVLNIASTTFTTQEGNTFYLPIELSNASATDIVVSYTTGGTATAGTDYSLAAAGNITIPAGVQVYQHPIFIYPDSTFDNNENFTVNLALVSGPVGTTLGTAATTVTLKEAGELAKVSFVESNQNIIEGNSLILDFTFSKTSNSPQTFSIKMEELSVTNTDYGVLVSNDVTKCTVDNTLPLEPAITFLANQTYCSLSLPFPVEVPTLDEPTEQLRFVILQPTNFSIGDHFEQMVSVIDNDPKSELSISFDGAVLVTDNTNEGTSKDIHFTLNQPSGFDIIVNYEVDTVNSVANLGSDFTLPSGTILIPKGTTSKIITLNTLNDNTYELTDEDLILNLTVGDAYTISAQNQVTLTINEVSTIPELTIRADLVNNDRDIDVNENDIVNIIFELNTPTNEDFIVQFSLTDIADAVYCGALPITHKCADITKDATNLSTHSGNILIAKGTTQGTLSFKINNDQLYELGVIERFRISLSATAAQTFTDNGDGTYTATGVAPFITIPGAVSDVDLDETNILDLNLHDIDTASIARFSGTKIISVSESIGDLNIPVYLNNASEADVNIKVQIVQTTSTSFNKPDRNDFTSIGNLTNTTENIGIAPSPAYTYSPLDYSGDSGVIYEGRFTIPAEATTADIILQIDDDILYESNEQFFIIIAQDDLLPPVAPAYPYSVNSAHNTYTVTLQESKAKPQVTFSLGSLPADTAEDSGVAENPTNIQTANTQVQIDALLTTPITWNFEATAVYQHQDMSFDFVMSGTAEFLPSITSKNLYMRGDYIFDFSSTGLNEISYLQDYNSVKFTVPAGSDDLDDTLSILVNRDYKYEEDETVIASFANYQNIDGGVLTTHTVNITNDDAPPILRVQNDGAYPFMPIIINEYDTDQQLELIVTDSSQIFKGVEITSVPFTLDTTITSALRQTVGNNIVTSTLTLDTSNSFKADLEVNPDIIQDFRKYQSITVKIDPQDDTKINLNTFLSYYNAPDTSYNPYFNLTVPAMAIYVSKTDTPVLEGTVYEHKAHSCVTFRGRAICYGWNGDGQLGRENAADFGGASFDDITILGNAINFGTDEFGDQLYVLKMALGEKHTCALLSNNSVKCFGNNEYGQLGNGTSLNAGHLPNTMGSYLAPVNLGTIDQIVDIKSMSNTTCAQFATDGMKCWGANDKGQAGTEDLSFTKIGDSSNELGTSMIRVKIPTNIKLFDTGANHACVVTVDSKLYCWGDNTNGQIGVNSNKAIWGDTAGEIQSAQVNIDNIGNINKLSLGRDHSCAQFSSATFNTRCWGGNYYGQLGLGRSNPAGAETSLMYDADDINSWAETNRTDSLGKATASFSTVLNLAGSQGGACFESINIPFNAAETCFGFNNSLNLGVTNNQFVQVYHPSNDIAAGGSYTCGVYDNYFYNNANVSRKHIRCWGSNSIQDGVTWTNTAVLNNIGSGMAFDGTFETNPVIPYGGTVGTCEANPANPVCNFRTQLLAIGDQAISSTGSQVPAYAYVSSALGGSYSWDWVTNFQGSGFRLNFELNYVYAMNREDVSSFSEIKLASGGSHICSVMTDNTKNETTELNDKYTFMCWGSNWSGQTGHDNTCDQIGGAGTCYNDVLTRNNLDFNF